VAANLFWFLDEDFFGQVTFLKLKIYSGSRHACLKWARLALKAGDAVLL
jgi:hypothetical protein